MKIYINLVKLQQEETPNKFVTEEHEGPEYSCRLAQKEPSRGDLKKRCSENMQETYRRIHGSSTVNLLHIFRIPFLRNTSGRLLRLLTNIYLAKSETAIAVKN